MKSKYYSQIIILSNSSETQRFFFSRFIGIKHDCPFKSTGEEDIYFEERQTSQKYQTIILQGHTPALKKSKVYNNEHIGKQTVKQLQINVVQSHS